MVEPSRPDTEPEEPSAVHPGPTMGPQKQTVGRRPYDRLGRELQQEDLNNPAVQKMVLSDIDRLEETCAKLQQFETQYHILHTECEVYKVRFNVKLSVELIHIACITVGAALLGYAPSLWTNKPLGWMMAVPGGILIIVGLIAKVVKL